MHRPVRLLRASALVVGGLVVAACTTGVGSSPGGGGSPSPAPSASPAAASDLVLRAAYEGGFIAPIGRRSAIPIVSVYADGRIVTEGAVPAIYPGPLVAPLVYRSVGPDGAKAILEAAVDAGLAGEDAVYPGGPVADAPQTVITVVHDGTQTVSRFDALGIGPSPDPSSSDPTTRTQAAAMALLDRLASGDTFGGTASDGGVLTPDGYRLFVTPGAPEASDLGLARPPVVWPLATPLAAFGEADPQGSTGARFGEVTGADAATLRPVLEAASQITPFTSGGTPWTIVVRPLLPDEAAAAGG
jgi:hypothetical protein